MNTYQTIKIFRDTREDIRSISLVTGEGIAEILNRLVKEEMKHTKAKDVSKVIKEVRSQYKTNE